MNDQLQVTTIRDGEQDEVLELLAEIRCWQDLAVDLLEARAIGDMAGLDGATAAMAEGLRSARQHVIVLRERVQAPMTTITTGNWKAPSPALAKAAEEVAAAVAEERQTEEATPPATPQKRAHWSPEARAAQAQRMRALNAQRRAERATTNGAAPAAEPAPQTPERPAPAPEPMPTNDEIRSSVGERMEACAQEIRGLIAAGAFAAAELSNLAARHSLSNHAVDKLVEEQQRSAYRARKASQAGAPTEKAAEVLS